ncbi:ATP-binding protein [Streptomyces sp. 11x1]|uniref:ATP-binding protein n=1 Tax=Streptomyces sp. 11x1 TaxID=3038642 RepID=UPI00292E996F|nr:ATP-binding protein [Streptomyces sp. 11x1]WNZ07909.1 ATP-binding protein [Streptomyces sp. 11x1]
MFDRFYRAGSALPAAAGSGLGLAIACRAAEANGGRLELDTRPGDSCTFHLLLPNRPTAASMVAAARLEKKHCVLLPYPDVGALGEAWERFRPLI